MSVACVDRSVREDLDGVRGQEGGEEEDDHTPEDAQPGLQRFMKKILPEDSTRGGRPRFIGLLTLRGMLFWSSSSQFQLEMARVMGRSTSWQ